MFRKLINCKRNGNFTKIYCRHVSHVKIDTTNTDYTAMLRTSWLKKTTLNKVLHKTQQLNNCFIACTCGVITLIKQTIIHF